MAEAPQTGHALRQYVQRVTAALEGEDLQSDAEGLFIFVKNVLDEIKDSEYRLACDMHCSGAIEKIVRIAPAEQLALLFHRLASNFENLLVSRCGSHVVQAMIERLSVLFTTEEAPFPSPAEGEEPPPPLSQQFFSLCSHFNTNLAVFMSDTYASHIVRTALCVLGGLPLASVSSTLRSKSSQSYRNTFVAQDESDSKKTVLLKSVQTAAFPVIGSLATTLLAMVTVATCALILTLQDNIQDLAVHRVASPVLQTMLLALFARDRAKCMLLCDALIGPEGDSRVTALLADPIGAHVVERILEVSSVSLFHRVYIEAFRGHLPALAANPTANYAVQKLLRHCPKSEDLSLIAAELLPHIENILAERCVGVVIALAEACARHAVQQKAFVKGLMDAFHIAADQPGNCALLILSMSTAERYAELAAEGAQSVDARYTLSGSLLLQALFKFNAAEVKDFIRSMLAVGGDGLVEMSCHKIGSRAVEAFFAGDISQKTKSKTLKLLEGRLETLACDKYGSHTLDKCWTAVDLASKERIAKELLESEAKLKWLIAAQDSFYGRMVLRNCRMEYFKKQQEEWAAQHDSNARKKKMFADIVDDMAPVKSAPKAKAKATTLKSDEVPADGDEIDAMFAGVSDDEDEAAGKKKKGKRKATEETADGDTAEGAKSGDKKKKKKMAADLGEVLKAIEGTKSGSAAPKKKKKSKEAAAGTSTTQGNNTTDSKKPKKKFMM